MPKAKKRSSQDTSPEIKTNQEIANISSDPSVAANWAGLVTPQGLPMLPFSAAYPTNPVDMNLVIALAQIMTMNALSSMGQNQVAQQLKPDIVNQKDEKANKKQLMMTLQERLKNRKSNPPPPIIKKKKVVRKSSASKEIFDQSSPSMSPLELLALATTAQQQTNSSTKKSNHDESNEHRGSFSYMFESEPLKSPGSMTDFQNGFPNIDWGKIQSPSPAALQSILSNVSETDKHT